MGNCFSRKTQKIGGIRYSMIYKKIKPLDLIVFRGADIISWTISAIQNVCLGCGDWTHVGVVVTTDLMPIRNGKPGRLYILESTLSGRFGDGVIDYERGVGTFGVQVRDLKHVIHQYDKDPNTRIGWCPLHINPVDHSESLAEAKKICTRFYNKYIDASYDYNCCNVCSTVLPCYNTNSTDKIFCSELATRLYQELDLIPSRFNSESIAPQELIGWSNNVDFPCLFRIPPITIVRDS
jgi:hypothetical protein